MRTYLIKAPFVIGDNENIIEVVDKWLREAHEEYDSPSTAFNIIETKTIRTQNNRARKEEKR